MAKEGTSIRLHPVIDKLVTQYANDMDTSKSYVIESALAQMFGSELPKWFTPGMRHVETNKDD